MAESADSSGREAQAAEASPDGRYTRVRRHPAAQGLPLAQRRA